LFTLNPSWAVVGEDVIGGHRFFSGDIADWGLASGLLGIYERPGFCRTANGGD